MNLFTNVVPVFIAFIAQHQTNRLCTCCRSMPSLFRLPVRHRIMPDELSHSRCTFIPPKIETIPALDLFCFNVNQLAEVVSVDRRDNSVRHV